MQNYFDHNFYCDFGALPYHGNEVTTTIVYTFTKG